VWQMPSQGELWSRRQRNGRLTANSSRFRTFKGHLRTEGTLQADSSHIATAALSCHGAQEGEAT
jgi:hypothetical protein